MYYHSNDACFGDLDPTLFSPPLLVVGVGGERVAQLACELKASAFIAFDVDPHVTTLMDTNLHRIGEAASRMDYVRARLDADLGRHIESLHGYSAPERTFMRWAKGLGPPASTADAPHQSVDERLLATLPDYLTSDASFAFVKNLIHQGRAWACNADAKNTGLVEAISGVTARSGICTVLLDWTNLWDSGIGYPGPNFSALFWRALSERIRQPLWIRLAFEADDPFTTTQSEALRQSRWRHALVRWDSELHGKHLREFTASLARCRFLTATECLKEMAPWAVDGTETPEERPSGHLHNAPVTVEKNSTGDLTWAADASLPIPDAHIFYMPTHNDRAAFYGKLIQERHGHRVTLNELAPRCSTGGFFDRSHQVFAQYQSRISALSNRSGTRQEKILSLVVSDDLALQLRIARWMMRMANRKPRDDFAEFETVDIFTLLESALSRVPGNQMLHAADFRISPRMSRFGQALFKELFTAPMMMLFDRIFASLRTHSGTGEARTVDTKSPMESALRGTWTLQSSATPLLLDLTEDAVLHERTS